MGQPTNYFVDHHDGSDGVDGSGVPDNDGSIGEPWKTIGFALEYGILGDPMGMPAGTFDATNGVQINIKAVGTLEDGAGEVKPITIDDIPGSENISHGAPLIFRGYQSAAGDWYPGKAGDAATLYARPGASESESTTNFPIVCDGWDEFSDPTNYPRTSSDIIFYDLVFDAGTSEHPHISLTSAHFVNCKFTGGDEDVTEVGQPIRLSENCTFINCHFSDMSSTTSSSYCINHHGSGLTVINCVFDFLGYDSATIPYLIIRSGSSARDLTLIGNVFMCGSGCRILHLDSGEPSSGESGRLFLINNTLYSTSIGGTPMNPIVGQNTSKRIVAIDNLTEGWAVGIVLKSAHNILAWGGNSAYNNTTNFPGGAVNPDIYFEFAGGNFDATTANSNKSLAQSPFLDAANKKMSCRPARISGGDEAVVGQSVSLWEDSSIVKRGDRGAVPRGPLMPPVDGGVIG